MRWTSFCCVASPSTADMTVSVRPQCFKFGTYHLSTLYVNGRYYVEFWRSGAFQVLNVLYAAIMFWPKFYLQLFGPSSEGRSILSILCNPTGEVISSKAARERFDRDQQRSNCYISLRPTHADAMSSHHSKWMVRIHT